MTELLDQGQIILGKDLYSDANTLRPLLIISTEEYPFYPSGYLALPVTTQDKPNTIEISEEHIVQVDEPIEIMPSYVNPYSPSQVNDVTKTLVQVSDEYVDLVLSKLIESVYSVK